MSRKSRSTDGEMRAEYDFDYSTAVRGKYHRRLLQERTAAFPTTHERSLKELLLAMPAGGEDADFERIVDRGRGDQGVTGADLRARHGFPPDFLATIAAEKILGIKAGRQPHRFIGIWAVVVERRVFVRSWSRKPRSWWRTFLEDPYGTISVAGREIPVRAVQTRSERLKDAVSQAYRQKYNTPGSLRYVRDFARAERRATTTELVPI